MSYDPSDPQDVGALINAVQGSKQIDLQRQILEMQKLLVLNQVRISQGLPPLAQLPAPPPPAPRQKITKDISIPIMVTIIIIVLSLFYFLGLKS